MILVSGATGQLGGEVIRQLLRKGAKGRFAVLARDAAKAAQWSDQGIEVRIADFDQPESLAAAFAGIDIFLFISTMSTERGPQQAGVVRAAALAGIRHIFYTGLAIRDITRSAVRSLMQSHFETETLIRDSGMGYTFLRNTIYADALPQIAGPDLRRDGIFLPAGSGRVPYAARAEMGEAIANALLSEGHEGKTYTLTGPEAWSFSAIAETLSRQSGRSLAYVEITGEDLARRLRAAGLPEFVIWLTSGTLSDIRDGQYDLASDDLQTLLGRRPKDLDALLSELVR